jgi:hypothetical protein
VIINDIELALLHVLWFEHKVLSFIVDYIEQFIVLFALSRILHLVLLLSIESVIIERSFVKSDV